MISLSDQPAKDFHNHVIIVEHQEGIDFSALASLDDRESPSATGMADMGIEITFDESKCHASN